MLAVLVIDLNNLKPINDQHGHATGDQLLMAAAHQVVSAVRTSDTVARLGGDRFVVLTRLPTTAETTTLQLERLGKLRESGVLTGDELAQHKAKILAQM